MIPENIQQDFNNILYTISQNYLGDITFYGRLKFTSYNSKKGNRNIFISLEEGEDGPIVTVSMNGPAKEIIENLKDELVSIEFKECIDSSYNEETDEYEVSPRDYNSYRVEISYSDFNRGDCKHLFNILDHLDFIKRLPPRDLAPIEYP